MDLRLRLSISNLSLQASVTNAASGELLMSTDVLLDRSTIPLSGWVGIGSNWDTIAFDNFQVGLAPGVSQASRCLKKPRAGDEPVTVACGSAEALSGMAWDLAPGPAGTSVALRSSDGSLCLESSQPPPTPAPPSPQPAQVQMWSKTGHSVSITISEDQRVASWHGCDKVALLQASSNTTNSFWAKVWHMNTDIASE